jgi:hypothetical protein
MSDVMKIPILKVINKKYIYIVMVLFFLRQST